MFQIWMDLPRVEYAGESFNNTMEICWAEIVDTGIFTHCCQTESVSLTSGIRFRTQKSGAFLGKRGRKYFPPLRSSFKLM